MTSDQTEEKEKTLRRLRKKLRQIEVLEAASRDLNAEEEAKVAKKAEIRDQVARILSKMKRKPQDLSQEEESGKRRKRDPNLPLDQEEQLEILVPKPETSDTVQIQVSTPFRSGSKMVWRKKSLLVQDLSEGHSDLVLACGLAKDQELVVTTGRDTQALTWDLGQRDQVQHSLRGHSDQVTSFCFIPPIMFGLDPDTDCLGVTGSLDSNLKIWDLRSGKLLKSIYTFNSITCIAFSSFLGLIVSATSGGKLEFFNPTSGKVEKSIVQAHDENITAVDILDDILASAASDASINLFKLSKTSNPELVYSSYKDGPLQHAKAILSLKILPRSKLVAYGDSGGNLKVLDWKMQVVRKIPNHLAEVGFTDAMCVSGDFLFATSYDLDRSEGHINMFALNKSDLPSYVCTWTDEECRRIFCLDCQVQDNDQLTMITGGNEVKVWRTVQQLPNEDSTLIKAVVLPLSTSSVVDSGSESETGDDLSERSEPLASVADEERPASWRCTLL